MLHTHISFSDCHAYVVLYTVLSSFTVFLVPSVPLLCRIWWTLMLSWMKMTWRSQTQLLLKQPAVEEPPRGKPARIGEVNTQTFWNHRQKHVVDCSCNRSFRKCYILYIYPWKACKRHMMNCMLYVCVVPVVLLRSWSRRAKENRRLVYRNLPVEVWVYFVLYC